jgi:TPR repeat protein
MQNINLKDLFLSTEEVKNLESLAGNGDVDAQSKLLHYHLYGPEPATSASIESQVLKACETNNVMALLYAGYIYAHGLGVSLDYSKAVGFYSKAFDVKYGIRASKTSKPVSAAKAEAELSKRYASITKDISVLVASLTDKSDDPLKNKLPDLSNEVEEFGEFLIAVLRCIMDDDDIDDNDYIISGLLMMAGHDDSPLWQYRVGLWFENSERNLEPEAAALWYEKAKNELPLAETALARVKKSKSYMILQGIENGTVKDCRNLYNYTSINPQNSIGWLIESALRGDESAVLTLEQKCVAPAGGGTVLEGNFKPDIYHKLIATEKENYADYSKKFFEDIKEASQKCQDEIKKQLAREEAARKRAEEARIKAEQEAIRKAEEEVRKREEAKRKAELEAKRKEEEEKRQAELAEKRKEAARKRAEELARKKEEERIQAELEAKRRAEEEKRKAEEAERKRILAEQKAYQKLLDEVGSLAEDAHLAITEIKSDYEDKLTDLKQRLGSAINSLRTKLNPCKPKLWHYLFCYAPDKNVDDFLSSEETANARLLREFQAAIDNSNDAHEKVEVFLRTEYADKSATALKTYITKLKKLVKELTDNRDECKKQLKAIEIQIKKLTNEISVSDFKCEFNGRKTTFIILLLWVLVSLGLTIFTGGDKGLWSLVISSGFVGSVFCIAYRDEFSFKNALLGFGSAAGSVLLILFIITCFILDSEISDTVTITQEAYLEAMDDPQKAIDEAEKSYADAMKEVSGHIEKAVEDKAAVEDYDYVYSAEDNGWRKVSRGDKYGFIDKHGKLVVSVKYDYIYSEDEDGWRKVEVNGKYGFINGKGKEIIKPKYDYIYSLEENGWRKVELKDKYGFVNSSGKEVVAVKYDYIYSEDDNGWRKVEINDKKGYINDSGTEIVAPIYDYIYSWSGGLAKVEKGNKTGYINRAGKLVQPLE